MCGIFGIAYGPKGPEGEEWTPEEFARLMFPAIEHRGPHAWGYMYCNSDADTIEWVKTPGSCKAKGAMDTVEIPGDVKWLVGHVRYATGGEKAHPRYNRNNHPIPHGDIVGVHNGVLRNWQGILDKTGREDIKSGVDSEAIFAAINKWGIRPGLRKIEGDMVAVWANVEEPEVLRIARLDGRPLVYATTEAGSLIFASEQGVIDECLIKHGPYHDLEDKTNWLMTVKQGKVSERSQYAEPIKSWAASERSGPAPSYSGGSPFRSSVQDAWPIDNPLWDPRGITDRMSGQPRRYGRTGATAPSSDAVSTSPTPHGVPDQKINQVDEFGGYYIGQNTWQVPGGALLNATQYVKWAVRREVKALIESGDIGLDEALTQLEID